MKDKIKVGEYVRTKNGYIIKVDENTTIFNLGYKAQYIGEKDIKTILTKENYMANCYKVGGENEKI